jgi:hypothetical protein
MLRRLLERLAQLGGAAEAIAEYMQKSGLTKGPLFRAQRHSKK